ncbi:hypothetical protein CEXT_157511 [Caerostris extrusa]|uniref:Ribosomal protein S14 n=1 Tax=Caerostris extrusa TaxID=172846 RepID=A0AAV4XJ47_CAEEX|nr:hypothetical protein CEXT_157511 [Caerostris extrusa]
MQKLFLSSRLKELDKLRLGANPRFSNPLKCAQKNNFKSYSCQVDSRNWINYASEQILNFPIRSSEHRRTTLIQKPFLSSRLKELGKLRLGANLRFPIRSS